jgi:hypothetical protein
VISAAVVGELAKVDPIGPAHGGQAGDGQDSKPELTKKLSPPGGKDAATGGSSGSSSDSGFGVGRMIDSVLSGVSRPISGIFGH